MKKLSLLISSISYLALTVISSATTINWTNTAGGNWNEPANWSPNQVPGSGDTASITSNGTYTVTLDASTTVGGLVLGGAAGTQILSTTPLYNFSLNGAGTIDTHGILSLEGGILSGGPVTIKGQLNWSNGRIGPDCVLNVATNGSVNSTNNGSYTEFGGILTNAGNINVNGGSWRCIDFSSYNGGFGWVVNLPTGNINVRNGAILDTYTDNPNIAPPSINNQGALHALDSDTTNLVNVILNNSGTVDVQSALFIVNGRGTNTGTFTVGSGSTLQFNNDYQAGGVLSGAGQYLLSGGHLSFVGTLSSRLNWTGGFIATDSTGTVGPTGLLFVDGGGNYNEMSGILTNNGTIQLNSGFLRCIDYSYYNGGYGIIVNQPGGLIDFIADTLLDYYSDHTQGEPVCINYGTIRKSGGTNSSAIKVPLINYGAIDVQIGTVSIAGGGNGNGTFTAEPGTTLNFNADYRVDSSLSGGGTNTFTFGEFALNGTLNTSNALLAGGLFGGTNGVIATHLLWTGGRIGPNSVLSIATNGTLVSSNVGFSYNEFQGVLTNNGTFEVSIASMRVMSYSGYNGGIGLLINKGLFDITGDATIDFYNDGPGLPQFQNFGVLRKSGGSGTSAFVPPLFNNGTIDAESGTLSINGQHDLTGGTINFGISSLNEFGKVAFPYGATLNGTLSASLNGGYVPIAPNSFQVMTYGFENGLFAVTNLPFADAWDTAYNPSSLVLTVLNARPTIAAITNRTVDELTTLSVTASASDPDVPAQTKTFSLVSPPTGMTIGASSGQLSWTPQQTQSPGTNLIRVVVTDNGTPALSATNSFMVFVREVNVAPGFPPVATQTVNELTQLTVANTATNFNIHSTNSGYALVNPPAGMTINSSGVITWTPAQTQSPSTNVITTIVTNTNPYDLINPRLTATNSFTVIVKEVNVAPSMAPIPQSAARELFPFAASSTATNFNIHSTNYGYGLINPPAGMTISATGTINWTPQQTQSPSTNTISVVATNGNPYDQVNPRLTATNTFVLIVQEVNQPPTLGSIPQQTVDELTLLTVTNSATNSNIHSTNYGFGLINPPNGMTIDSNGVITWTPAQTESPSTNLVTTVVTNGNPYDTGNPRLTATNTFTVIVREVNVAPVLPTVSTKTVNAQALLTVTNTATESNIHATVGYQLTGPAGASIDANGIITWTPSRSQGPSTNLFTTVVTNTDNFDQVNPHLSATNLFAVIVYAPTLSSIANQTVNPGQTVNFTVSATDNDPSRILTYSLQNAPAGASITSSGGVFTWRPSASLAGSSNYMQVTVTDNSTPAVTDTKSFYIAVNALQPVTIKPLGATNGVFSMQVTGTSGPDYILSTTTDFINWSDIVTNNNATPPIIFNDANAGTQARRFYRVRLNP